MMQQYLQVVTDYIANNGNSTNEDLEIAIHEITRDIQSLSRSGMCLEQLREYAMELLLKPYDECSVSMGKEKGCDLVRAIIISYSKSIQNDQDEADSNLKMIENFISKISPKMKQILNELLQILLQPTNDRISTDDQKKLGQIIELIDFMFNDQDCTNNNYFKLFILNSDDLRSMVLSLGSNVISKRNQIENKVENEIITIDFFRKLSDFTTQIIAKYFAFHEFIAYNASNMDINEIMDDTLI